MKIGKYRHYKGNYYEVIGVARDSETMRELVVYRALYDSSRFGSGSLWIRPLENFNQNVFINGKVQCRFEYVKESAV
jgi:hypothetical protein